MSEILDALTVGHDQVLVLRVRGADIEALMEPLAEWVKENGLENRVLVVDESTEMAVIDK